MMVVNKSSSDIDKVLSLERRKCQWTWCEWRWCFESKEKIGFKKFRFWSRSSAAAPLLNRRTSSFQQVERRKRWHFWLFCTWVGWLLPLSLSSSLPWPATAAPCHHVTNVVRRWHILAYNYNVWCNVYYYTSRKHCWSYLLNTPTILTNWIEYVLHLCFRDDRRRLHSPQPFFTIWSTKRIHNETCVHKVWFLLF